MSTHYSANQYENAFAANRLQNYEVPNQYKEHPSPKEGFTRPISNDRGHLLPGVPRSSESPWGNFKGTWDEHMDCRRTKHFQKTLTSSQKAFMRISKETEMSEQNSPSRDSASKLSVRDTPQPQSVRQLTPTEENRAQSIDRGELVSN